MEEKTLKERFVIGSLVAGAALLVGLFFLAFVVSIISLASKIFWSYAPALCT